MRILLLMFIIVNLLACARPVETRYYMLDYVPTPTAARLQLGPWPYHVRIKDFTIAEAYRRDQIIYRQSPHELRFYNFELWAVKPEFLVTDMVFKHMREAHLFQDLQRTFEHDEPDFVLKGEITALEEYDNQSKWYAHLAFNMTLQDAQNQTVVWTQSWDYRKSVEQQEPVFIVRDLSVLLEKSVNESMASIDSVMIIRRSLKSHARDTTQTLPNDSLHHIDSIQK